MNNTHNKIFIYLFLGSILCTFGFSQSAVEYFSPSMGSSWRYQRFDLDSTQNIIGSSKVIITDSLVGTKTIGNAKAFILKSYPSTTRDTTFVNTIADIISFYNGGYPLDGLVHIADSLRLGFIPQVNAWYPYIKFGTPPQNNKTDTLFRRDSTVILDSTEVPLTLTITRTRRAPGVVTVPAGTFFSAVPVEITLKVDTWILTPFGNFAVPLLKLTDTLFIAKNNWIVKEIQGSTYFPLSKIDNAGVPQFNIPGYVRLLELQTLTTVETKRSNVPQQITLGQNFPNPFNGMTTISIELEKTTTISLTITDILGRRITTLVNGQWAAGIYHFQWDSEHIPSGMYFYELQTVSGFREIKKMILQK